MKTSALKPKHNSWVRSSELVSGSVQTTLTVLWRTSGFLQGLADDIKHLSPERAAMCRQFIKSLEDEAKRLSANSPDQRRRVGDVGDG